MNAAPGCEPQHAHQVLAGLLRQRDFATRRERARNVDARQAHAMPMPSVATRASSSISSGFDDVGRHEVQRRTERAQQRARFERVAIDAQAAAFLPGVGRARGAILDELDREDHAALADLRDVRMVAQMRHARGHASRGFAIALEHRLLAEYRQRGVRRGAGQRIARVAVRMQEGIELHVFVVEGVVHGFRGQHHGQRQVAAGEPLGQAQVVGPDAGLLAGEHRAGAPESHRDLVGDEMHAVPVAGLAQQREVQRVVHAHAAGALHQRLDDHRGHLVVVSRQRRLHVREHVLARAAPRSRRLRVRTQSGEGTVITSMSSGR